VTAVATRQGCEQCHAEISELDPSPVCPTCGGLLEIIHAERSDAKDLPLRFAERRQDLRGPNASGVWRYRELVMPSATDDVIVSHPEGNTPLLARHAVSEWAGVERLLMKHEGHNPTGSFKDRGMTVAMTQAKRVGAEAVACASTGNTSASLAAYAAQANLRALVFVPVGQVALGKLTQTLAYGARTLLVRGNFDDCLTLHGTPAPRSTFSFSIRSTRFGSRDRSRSCSSCSINSTGIRPIGLRSRPATSETRRHSERRSANCSRTG
jgi:threonine synthase